MKKYLAFFLCAIFLFAQTAYSSQGKVEQLFSSEAVATTGTATSEVIPIKSGGWFGLWYQAVSASSAPDLKIEYEMSYNTTAANFVEPSTAADIESSLVAETAIVKSFSPPPMPYLRIKVTGNASNPADTVITMYLFTQE